MDKDIQELKYNNYHMSMILQKYIQDMKSCDLPPHETKLLQRLETNVYPYLLLKPPLYTRPKFNDYDIWKYL
jgi:hypothetical protein